MRKHGIAFEDAMEAFMDPMGAIRPDSNLYPGEERWLVLGVLWDRTLAVVAHVYEELDGLAHVRIISARKATQRERLEYETGINWVREPSQAGEYNMSERDDDGMCAEYDFSNAVRGKYYRPNMVISFPIYDGGGSISMWNSMTCRQRPNFVWDDEKALSNERKHGISFKLASTAFRDPLAELFRSNNHEHGEDRWTLVGMTRTDVLVVVVHLYLDVGVEERVRLISARKATFKERREYESGEYSIREAEQYEKAEGEWELDFSKAIRGRFRYARFQVFIDNEVLGYFHTQERKTGIDTEDAINEVLRRHLGLPLDSPGADERR